MEKVGADDANRLAVFEPDDNACHPDTSPSKSWKPVLCRTSEHLVELRARLAMQDIIFVEQEEAARKPHHIRSVEITIS